MTFLGKKAYPFSLKSSQNGENSTAHNSRLLSDPDGKVSIYLGSTWLKLSNDIGVYRFSM
jgi:hypothetical protein